MAHNPELEAIFEAVKAANLAEIMPALGSPVRRGGRFDCPLCGAKGRSCGAMRDEPSRFHCFSCSRSGSLLDVAMARVGDASVTRRVLEEVQEILRLPRMEAPERPERPLYSPEFLASIHRASYNTPAQVRHEVHEWFRHSRGLLWHPQTWGTLPAMVKRPDLAAAREAGPVATFPLYAMGGHLVNMLARPIRPTVCGEGETKPWKSRLVNSGPGTTGLDGQPIAYVGALRDDCDLVWLLEGALDTLTAGAIVCELRLPVTVLGAYSADDLRLRWATPLKPYRVLVTPHLDTPRLNQRTGVTASQGVEAARAFIREHGNASMFPWRYVLEATGWTFERFREAGRNDLNDLIRADIGDGRETDLRRLVRVISNVFKGLL